MCIRVHLWLIHPRVIRIVIVDQCLPWSDLLDFAAPLPVISSVAISPLSRAALHWFHFSRLTGSRHAYRMFGSRNLQNLGKHASRAAQT